MRLTVFLGARLAEEEDTWVHLLPAELPDHAWVVEREIAHCEARRLILDDCVVTLAGRMLTPGVQELVYRFLVLMAAPYAEHEDWQEVWEL